MIGWESGIKCETGLNMSLTGFFNNVLYGTASYVSHLWTVLLSCNTPVTDREMIYRFAKNYICTFSPKNSLNKDKEILISDLA